MRSISVVYPTYNEESNIETTVSRSVESLSRQFEDYEILIVNDASTDSTAQLAEKLAAENPHIRVIHNEKNLRAGATLMRGFAIARGDIVTHNGMDYPFNLDDLAKMVPLMENFDIVAATRLSRPGYSAYRKVLSYGNLTLLHLLFPLKLRDYNFCQMYKREVLQNISIKASSTGFVTPELMIRAYQRGYKIGQVDIEYLPREAGVARSGDLIVIWNSLKDMLRLWAELVREPRKKGK